VRYWIESEKGTVIRRGLPEEVHIEDVKQVNGHWLVEGTSGVVLVVVGLGRHEGAPGAGAGRQVAHPMDGYK
jgi:hypothetical protein